MRLSVIVSSVLLVTLPVSCGGDDGDKDGGLEDATARDSEVVADGAPDGGLDGSVDAGPPDERWGVVIAGAGSGGIAAAIQAARMGVRVLLLERTDYVGGQMTAAGVTSMDGGRRPPGGTGLYQELEDRIGAYYGDTTRFPPSGKAIDTCYGGPDAVCFEPHVGRQILEAMLDEAGVTLRLRAQVVTVTRAGNRVTGVVTDDGTVIESHVLVDATEHGDVIPLAGAAYRVGRSTSDAVDGAACIQDITYLAVIREYPGAVPPELRIDTPPPGYDDARRDEFASLVVDEPGVVRLRPEPSTWLWHSTYRGMPDSTNPVSYTNAQAELITRTGVNYANDYPGYYVDTSGAMPRPTWRDTLTVAYLEDPAERARIDCDAKLRTIQLLYYFQNELGKTQWSVANDEGYDSAWNVEENDCATIPASLDAIERLLPPIPYVRESRRIVAMRTLTAADLRRAGGGAPAESGFSTSIAVGDYPSDLHNCGSVADLDPRLGETTEDTELATHGGPFEVPFETLVPETVDGLLAAEKNIGVSRRANGAIRLQPITMNTGQAVGVIAALAVGGSIQPRDVEPVAVQEVLIRAGAAISRRHFDDVPLEDPRWADVQMASAHDVLIGTGPSTFAPASTLTRAQAAILVVRLTAIPLDPVPAVATFDDVPVGHFAFAYVEAIAREGITSGCGASPPLFCPDAPLTRAHLAVFLARALSLDLSSPPATPTFSDVPVDASGYAAIEAMATAGFMPGCAPAAFCPDAPVTRGEAAGVIHAVLLR